MSSGAWLGTGSGRNVITEVVLPNEMNAPGAGTSRDGVAIARSLSSPDAFTEVFDRHFVAVHRYLARRVGRDLADDVAARTFMVAFDRRSSYQDRLGSARPWLLGIATNVLREERRSGQRLQTTLEQLGNEAWVSANGAGDGEGEADYDLAGALARLDVDQRDALVLYAWGELSYAEIAAALEIPIGTVRSRISRACASLRSDLHAPFAGEASLVPLRRDDDRGT
jgi:RNA polymerase sigma factor (sigma-70 family)